MGKRAKVSASKAPRAGRLQSSLARRVRRVMALHYNKSARRSRGEAVGFDKTARAFDRDNLVDVSFKFA